MTGEYFVLIFPFFFLPEFEQLSDKLEKTLRNIAENDMDSTQVRDFIGLKLL